MVRLTESAVYIRTKCGVDAVKKLNLWGCDIDDIGVCEKMKNLEVLSLSVNRVSNLEPLRDCIRLKELYLRKNNIESLSELEHLKGLPALRTLWIDENPCTAIGEYRYKVVRMLPQITKLDDRVVSSDDHLEPEESAPECDMHTSMYSVRSARSSSAHSDLMTRSLYVTRNPVMDTVMQPQIATFEDASDEEPPTPSRSAFVPASLLEDDWGDFNIDEDPRTCSMDALSSRMCMSMYEERPRHPFPRSASAPRRRISPRQPSASPHRQNRLTKILSAVSVLMDELDPDGLRDVIDEAQRRIKKQR